MIVACHHCEKPFKYLDVGADGVLKAQDINCPHCGKTHSWRVTAGAFQSAILTDVEDKQYVAEQRLRDE